MWVRTDDLIIRHPKILAVGERGAYFYWASLVYAAQYRTDGFIARESLAAIAPVSDYEERAHLLVTARAPGYEDGLWEEAPGGYRIHDYLDYQPSAASLRKREQADRERLRAARERGTGRSGAKDSHTEPTSPASDAGGCMEDWDEPPPLASSMRTPTEPRRGRREPLSRSTRAPAGSVDAHAGAERAQASSVTHRPAAEATEPRSNDVAARSLRSRPVPSPSPSPSPSPNPDRSQDPDRVCAPDPRATAREEHTHTEVGDEIIAERSATVARPCDGERLPSVATAAEPGEPVPASARSPEATSNDGEEVLALQVLELLRALPAPMCHLATLENARSFALARNLGLALPDIRSAIAAAAVKVGKHRNARPEEPQTIAALAQHVGAFIVNQRPAAVAPTSQRATANAPADATGVDRFLSRWRELYAQTEGITYTVTDEDREHAAELVGLIAQAAQEHAAKPGVEAAGLEERIAERWMRRYLRDEGVNAYLVKARHALRHMKRGVATYGLPQGQARAAGTPARSEPECAALMPAAESAACGEAILRMLAGGSGPGPAKVVRASDVARRVAG
jgi:hypothetical protein